MSRWPVSARSRGRAVAALLTLAWVVCSSALGQPVAVAQLATDSPAGSGPPAAVFVGIDGLTWDQVDPQSTPTLHNLLAGSTGSLVRRAQFAVTCPVDGWLTLSAGRRAAADRPQQSDPTASRCPPMPAEAPPPRWGEYREAAAAGPYSANPGTLADALSDHSTPAAGIGPGASIALTTTDGRLVGDWHALAEQNIGDQVRSAAEAAPGGVVVVDLGERSARTDALLGEVLAALPADTPGVLASLPDAGPAAAFGVLATWNMRPAADPAQAAPGRGDDVARLTSSSTRQPGLVTIPDLTATMLRAVRVEPPAAVTGAAVTADLVAHSPAQRLASLRDAAAAAGAVSRVVAAVIVVIYLPLVAVLVWIWASRTRRGLRWPAWARRVYAVAGVIPAAMFLAQLAPWWRANPSLLGIIAAIAAATAALAVVIAAPAAVWGSSPLRWIGAVGAVTMVVLAGDLVTGSSLQVSSVIGVQPLLGGRFYGLGNPGFAVFGAATVMTAAAVACRWPGRLGAAAVLGVGAVGVVVDVAPGWGSDFGGPLALIPAIGVLAARTASIRITWRRAAAFAVVAVAFVALVSVLDWSRPAAQRTHLGRAVQTTLDGELAGVVARKLSTNWELLTASALTVAIVPVTAAVAILLLAPDRLASHRLVPESVKTLARPLTEAYWREPALAHLTQAWLVLVGIGAVVNDSGAVVPVVGALVLLPALIATIATPAPPRPPRTRPRPLAPGRT